MRDGFTPCTGMSRFRYRIFATGIPLWIIQIIMIRCIFPDLNFVENRAIVPKQKFERAFKVMKNGVYFIVIALLVAELVKMTCDVILWTQNEGKSQKMEYL